MPTPGRPPTFSKAVIAASLAEAVQRDLEKDSLTSTEELMTLVEKHKTNEEEAQGRNSLHRRRPVSATTQRKTVKRITPVLVRNGCVQNNSRNKALKDCRNAISCAATWPAVAAMSQQFKLSFSRSLCTASANDAAITAFEKVGGLPGDALGTEVLRLFNVLQIQD